MCSLQIFNELFLVQLLFIPFSCNMGEYRCQGAVGTWLTMRGNELGVKGEPRMGSTFNDGYPGRVVTSSGHGPK